MAISWNQSKRWVATALLSILPSAHAIDINVTLDKPENNPSYDPDGSKLLLHMQVAAEIWERLRPGNDVYNITAHWENFQDGNTIATAFSIDNSIRFKTMSPWFLDPTPTENEEFGVFQSTYYKNLDFGDKGDFFPGTTPPNLLEVGYGALPVAGGAADGLNDLLSVALHEIGHLTGVSWNDFAPDVPLSPQWLGFRNGVKVARANDSHISPPMSLMDPTINAGRTFPSALDIMVSAHEKGDPVVNLDRITFIGNVLNPLDQSWENALNWLGGNTPTSSDEVLISDGETVILSTTGVAGKLGVTSELQVLGKLTVDDTFTIWGDSAQVYVPTDGLVKVLDTLSVEDGQLKLEGGTVITDHLVIDQGADLRGYGVVEATQSITNEGFISARDGLLEFSTLPGVTYDLDGFGSGWVNAIDGDLAFGNGQFLPFDNKMTIAEGHSISFRDFYLQFDPDAVLKMRSASAGGEALFTTDALSQFTKLNFNSSRIEVEPDVTGRIRVDQMDFNGSQILIISDGGKLTLEGSSYFYGGTQIGEGTVVFDGSLNIAGNTKLDFKRVDLDGAGESTYVDVFAGQKLTVIADSIDSNNRFNGTLHLANHAEADVQITGGFIPAWTMSGLLEMNQGSKLVTDLLFINGKVNVQKGSARIEANTLFLNKTSETVLDEDTILTIESTVNYNGGSIKSASGDPVDSMYRQQGKGHVTENTTIIVESFDWDPSDATDSSTIIDERKTLEIIAGRVGSPSSQFLPGRQGFGDVIDINGGTLDVTVGADGRGIDLPSFWKITKSGVLNLNYDDVLPTVQGSLLVNEGLISGMGQFNNRVNNLGTVEVGHEKELGVIIAHDLFNLDQIGSIHFELAGLNPYTGYDQLQSTDLVKVGGELVVSLLSGFLPPQGSLYRIIDATGGGSVTGQFDSLVLPFGPTAWNVIYGPDYVDLRFTAVPEAGSLSLVGVGLAGAYIVRRIRRSRPQRGS